MKMEENIQTNLFKDKPAFACLDDSDFAFRFFFCGLIEMNNK
jgi:hypothetical protein